MNRARWRFTSIRHVSLLIVSCLVIGAGTAVLPLNWAQGDTSQQKKVRKSHAAHTSQAGKSSSNHTSKTTSDGTRLPVLPGAKRESIQEGAQTPFKPEDLPGFGARQLSGVPGVASQMAVDNFQEIALAEAEGRWVKKPQVKKPQTEKIPVLLKPYPNDEILVSRPAAIMSPNQPTRVPSPVPASTFLALEDNGNGIPPDTHGAVGPNHLVVATNQQVRIQSRTGSNISTVSLDAFWRSLEPFSFTFDPKVLYDPYANRFMMTVMIDFGSPNSSVLLAVSKTSDPTGQWNFYKVDTDSTDALSADYPSIGFNKTWIAIQVNMFSPSSGRFTEAKLFVFDKADAYAGGAGRVTTIRSPEFVLVPGITYSDTQDTLFCVGGSFNSSIRISTITGAVGSETLTVGATVSGGSDGWSFNQPGFQDSAPQNGSAVRIDSGDSRMQNVVFRNGSIWCAHTIFRPGGSASRAAVQVWQLSTSGNVLQRIILEDPNSTIFYAYPSVAVNKNNDALIGYSRFSPTQFASANYAFRAGSDTPNTLRDDTVLKAGEGAYDKNPTFGANRWGDYSNTVVDPVNDTDMWTIQEFAAPGNRFGTWWGRVALDPGAGDTTPPTVQLQSPNGGESVKGSERTTIKWASNDNNGVIQHDLQLSTDGGTTFGIRIAAGISGSVQEFSWAVPLVETTRARVQITALDSFGNDATDTSDADFSIARPPLSPAQNVTATVNGQTVQLAWEAARPTPGANITGYSIYRSRTSPVTVAASNRLGTFSIQTRTFSDRPSPADGKTQYFYVVTGVYNTGESGPSNEVAATPESNNDTKPPVVQVLAPNGGETVNNGEPLQIRWQSSDAGGALASHAIDLSVDGGTTFGTSVAAGLGATAQSFVFQIPTTIASPTARIRVTARDTAGNNGQDTSDANFTIKSTDTVAPTVTVTAPAAGQKVKVTGSSSFTVTWTSTDNIGVASHDVLLAKDGTTFQNLATGLSGTTTTLSLTQSLVGPAGKSKAAKLRVVAKDAGGNSGTGETGAFKLIVK